MPATQEQQPRESMEEAVRSFLTDATSLSKSVACVQCGTSSNLKQITAFLFGSSDAWKILLPLCESCASQESGDGIHAEQKGEPEMNMNEPNNENWEKLYRLAALEVDGKKMPERVAAVRETIRARLKELEQSSDHHAERRLMKRTLERLVTLETDARNW